MGWNHRVLASEHKDELYLSIHEVYYDKNGKPDGFTAKAISIGGYGLIDIAWTLERMKECMEKPVLWSDDKFPSECIDDRVGVIKKQKWKIWK